MARTPSTPARLSASAMNTNYPHAPDYLLDRPNGFDEFVFIHFLTPCEIYTACGMEQGKPGQCIIYAPGFRQWNRSLNVPLRNNWLHFSGPDAEPMLKQYALPMNALFHLDDAEFVAPAIQQIRRETQYRAPWFADAVEHRLRLFFLVLARQCSNTRTGSAQAAESTHQEAFQTLRACIQETPDAPWSVQDMADRVHLSRTRFSVLYRNIFGVSPMEDLIRTRLHNARMKLGNSALTVEAVATKCGFNSVIHFHHLFRRRFGCSPRAYAQGTAPRP